MLVKKKEKEKKKTHRKLGRHYFPIFYPCIPRFLLFVMYGRGVVLSPPHSAGVQRSGMAELAKWPKSNIEFNKIGCFEIGMFNLVWQAPVSK
jgi:hypothetical protein